MSDGIQDLVKELSDELMDAQDTIEALRARLQAERERSAGLYEALKAFDAIFAAIEVKAKEQERELEAERERVQSLAEELGKCMGQKYLLDLGRIEPIRLEFEPD